MYSIFIIEDDQTIRTELAALLKRYGYQIETSEDFLYIADRALAANPHLILLDLSLPVADGYQVFRQIRAASDVPIIVVTSRDSDMDELMSMNLGADDFMTKPYNTQILLARILAVLSRTYGARSETKLHFEMLTADLARSVAEVSGKAVELSKNELRILQLLMQKGGAVVSRDELMNALWQGGEFVDDNTLSVNLSRLRKKLGEIGAEGYLTTKRGQGYRLGTPAGEKMGGGQ